MKSTSRAGALELLAVAGIFCAAVAAYLSATQYFFSQDDFTFLGRSIGFLPYPDIGAPLGARLISTRLYFEMMFGLFGLNPEPYHWASLILHALNAVLVYAIARCWTGARGPAVAAGFLFATLDLAFTAVFWISGVQDLLATFFLLASALVWVARKDKTLMLSLLSAGLLALSFLSKETGVLALAILALMALAQGVPIRRAARALMPHALLTVAALALFVAQSRKVPDDGAYGTGFSAGLFHNLSTYIKWTVDIVHPFKDRVAIIDNGAWKAALPAAAVVTVLLLLLRKRPARHAWASLGWYLLALAPVLPLLRHTYLYYLYPAAAGAAIMAGILIFEIPFAMSKRLGRHGRTAGSVLAIVIVAAVCLMGIRNIGARDNVRLEPDYVLPRDHVLRAAELAGNADSTFVDAPVPDGANLLLINPYSPESVDLSGASSEETQTKTIDLVRLALREGDVFKVRRPDIGGIRFAGRMEAEYEGDHGLLYDAYGRLTYLGTGADIWANLSTVHLLRTSLIDESIRCGRRALELVPGHPRAGLNLGIALAMTGNEAEAREHLTRASNTLREGPLRAQALRWLQTLETAE